MQSARRARLAPPEEKGAGATPDLGLFVRLAPYAAPDAWAFALALLTVFVAAGASLVQPLLLRDAVNAVLVARDAAALVDVVWLYVLSIAIDLGARFVQTYVLQLGGQRTLSRLRLAVFAKIQRLHLTYLDRTPVGRVVTRVTNDVDALGELFASGAVTAVADVLMLIGIVVFMLALDWRLSLVAFAALPPLALAVDVLRRFAREAFRAIRTRIAQLNAYLAEQVQGVAVIQAFRRQQECLHEYEEINDAYRSANHRAIRFDALLYSVVESVSAITVAILLWYAAVRVGGLPAAQSAVWVGTVVAFYDYIQRFFVPIRDLSQKYTIVQAGLAAAERIFELLAVAEEDAPAVDRVPEGEPVAEDVELALEGVRFGYRPGRWVLDGVDLSVRRGETIALVGATGAGKTTVTALFQRLYDVSEGRVLVGGRDVRAQPVEALRSRFAVVAQDVFLFAGTVLSNVAAAAASPDAERARWALEQVGAWELVTRRGGLEASIDERGANFSAGERQLLAFARALYLDRPILVLDEATAHVDSESEARLSRALSRVLEGRTAVVVAHRLSTIRHADRIVVFHKGRIAEEGDHDALVARDGIYARLHRLQGASHAELG